MVPRGRRIKVFRVMHACTARTLGYITVVQFHRNHSLLNRARLAVDDFHFHLRSQAVFHAGQVIFE